VVARLDRFSFCCPPKPFRPELHAWPHAWRPIAGADPGTMLTADLRLPHSNGTWPWVIVPENEK